MRLKPLRRLSNLVWVFVATLSLAIIAQPYLSPSIAQSPRITEATIAETIGQQVLINRDVANKTDKAELGDRIRTTNARAELQFNTGAIARLGKNSALIVGSQCFQLQQGQILVDGRSNGCTSSVRAGVRGTTYLLEILEGGKTHYAVLEGEIELTNPEKPNAESIKVQEGEGIIVNAEGEFSPIEKMAQQLYETIMTGELVADFSNPLPGLKKIENTFNQLFPGEPFPVEIPTLPSLPRPNDNNNNVPRLPGDRSSVEQTPDDVVARSSEDCYFTQSPIQTQQNWKTQLGLSRLTTNNSAGIIIQLQVLDKPVTRYANAIYQLYAFHNNRWIPLYTNIGSRLIENSSGAFDPMSEKIPLEALRLQSLGKRVNLDNLELKAVVQIRYDLSRENRDLSLELEHREDYRDLPLSNCY